MKLFVFLFFSSSQIPPSLIPHHTQNPRKSEILICVLPLGNGGAQAEDPDLPRQALGPRHPPDRHGRPLGHRQLPLLGRPPHAPQLPLRRRLL
jgi:hypothetical protein